MSATAQNKFERILFETVRERLMHRQSVHLPGVGTFSVDHQASGTDSNSHENNEPLQIRPPKDRVIFRAEEKTSR